MKSIRSPLKKNSHVTLKTVAQHLGLTAGTVSAVLNNSAASHSIPDRTRNRILQAARELNYQPNFMARSLRLQRTYTIGVILEEIGDGYGSTIVSGVEEYIREKNYFFLTVAHRHERELLQTYSEILIARGVEGFITVDTSLEDVPSLPTVAVAGHRALENVTNIILDHRQAALLGLQHLKQLGHEQIAFLRGQPQSADSAVRWDTICEVAQELGIEINPHRVVRLQGSDSSPELGYPFGKELLARRVPFTALFAYNDISAIGAMRAFQEAGLRVPADVSVVGFDDIVSASFCIPGLTTIRQPLKKMGRLAAQTLLARIEETGEVQTELTVKPELVIRNSSSPRNSNLQNK